MRSQPQGLEVRAAGTQGIRQWRHENGEVTRIQLQLAPARPFHVILALMLWTLDGFREPARAVAGRSVPPEAPGAGTDPRAYARQCFGAGLTC